MAKKHLTSIHKIIGQLEKLQTEIDALHEELQEKYDNLPEHLQEDDYGEDLQSAIDALDTASFDGVGNAVDELRDAAFFLETHQPVKAKGKGGPNLTIPLAAAMIMGSRNQSEKASKQEDWTTQYYDPFDTHRETSFDWVDEDNDGYDDRMEEF